MLTRGRPRTPAFLPPPAPLPNLRDALARRASIFGPVEADEAPAVSQGLLLGGADAGDVAIVSIRPPSIVGYALMMQDGWTDVGDGMAVFCEDVPSAVGDAALRLALDHGGQEAVTPARRLRFSGGVRHAFVVALCHGGRLLGVKPTPNIALWIGSDQSALSNDMGADLKRS